jgi:hypothetical protein
MKKTFNELPVGAKFTWDGTPTPDRHDWLKTGAKSYRHASWPVTIPDDRINELIKQGNHIVFCKSKYILYL